MITGIIPENYIGIDQRGVLKKIKFIEIKRYSHREDILLDLYYHKNFACSEFVTQEQLDKIKSVEKGEAISLYNKVFYNK